MSKLSFALLAAFCLKVVCALGGRRLFSDGESAEANKFQFECVAEIYNEGDVTDASLFVFNTSDGYCKVNKEWGAELCSLIQEFVNDETESAILLPVADFRVETIENTLTCAAQSQGHNSCAVLMQAAESEVVAMLRLMHFLSLMQTLQSSMDFLRICVECHSVLLQLWQNDDNNWRTERLPFWIAPIAAAKDAHKYGLTAWQCPTEEVTILIDGQWMPETLQLSNEVRSSLTQCSEQLYPFLTVLWLRGHRAPDDVTCKGEFGAALRKHLTGFKTWKLDENWIKEKRFRWDLLLELCLCHDWECPERNGPGFYGNLYDDSDRRSEWRQQIVYSETTLRNCELDDDCDHQQMYTTFPQSLAIAETQLNAKQMTRFYELASVRIDVTNTMEWTPATWFGICEALQRNRGEKSDFQQLVGHCFAHSVRHKGVPQWIRNIGASAELSKQFADAVLELKLDSELPFLSRVRAYFYLIGSEDEWYRVRQSLSDELQARL